MRVLAVRGKNLASLPWFEIRFDQPPLAGAGIVAVTGPTGAGKSTILDAIPLALYGRTPRLKAGEAAGQILTRGAVEALAEVEIEVGGEVIVSRWSRRISRGGKLQPAVMEVHDRSGVGIASGVDPVREAVTKRIGLRFDELRQAVMLAQNQFAAFLAATPADRALLLERVSAVDIYRRVSIEAYRRAELAEGRLREIHSQRDAIGPDPAWARATLARERAARVRDRGRADEAVASLREVVQRHGAVDDARRALDEAEAHRRDLVAALPDVGSLRDQVDRADRASRVAPASVRAELAERACTQAAADAASSRGAADRTAVAAEAARRRLEQARDLEQVTEGARSRIDLRLHEVRTWQDTERALGASVAAAREDEARARADEAVFVQAAATRARRAAEREQARTALAAEATVDPSRVRRLLEAVRPWTGQAAALRSIEERWRAASAEEADAARAHADASAEASRARTVQRLIRTALVRLSALPPIERDPVAAGADLVEGQRRARAWATLERVASEHDDAEADRRALEESRRHAARAAEEADRCLTLAREAVAANAQAQARDAAAASLREGLAPGAPCPVCGSLDHPVHRDTPASPPLPPRPDLDLALSDAEGRRDATRAAHDALQVSLERSEAQVRHLADARIDAAARAQPPPAPWATWAEALVALESVANGAATQAAEILRLEREASDADAYVARVTEEEASARATWARAQGATRAAATARAEAAAARAASRRTLLAFGVDPDRSIDELAAELSDQLDRAVHRDARRVALEATALEDEAAARDDAERAAWWADRVSDAARACAGAEAALAAHHAAGLEAGGVDPQAAADRLAAWCASVTARAADAARDLHHAVAAARVAAEVADAAAAEAARRAQDRAEAVEVWREACVEAGFVDADDARRARFDPSDLSRMRARIAAHDHALAAADGAVAAARRRLDAQLADGPDHVGDPDDARLQLSRMEVRRDDLAIAVGVLDQKLTATVEAARRARALDDDLLIASAHATTARRLRGLIGQATGDKFVRYAQALTMRRLVALANHHLRSLRPRYTLAPSADDPLGFDVVDGLRGFRSRPVDTLSGGESFLLSLALALGLSDLARGTIRVDSLFLDEGFGSLDPDSLDQALSALDALQAEGRQIVVVSHVELLKERVAARIEVVPLGDGLSAVRVVGRDPLASRPPAR